MRAGRIRLPVPPQHPRHGRSRGRRCGQASCSWPREASQPAHQVCRMPGDGTLRAPQKGCAILGGRGSCRAETAGNASARQEPRPPQKRLAPGRARHRKPAHQVCRMPGDGTLRAPQKGCAILGGRGSCRAETAGNASARQEPRPPQKNVLLLAARGIAAGSEPTGLWLPQILRCDKALHAFGLSSRKPRAAGGGQCEPPRSWSSTRRVIRATCSASTAGAGRQPPGG